MGGKWGLQAVYPILLERILETGVRRAPRGKGTYDIVASTVAFSVDRGLPLLGRPGMSSSFAAYETLWIMSGQQHVRGYAAWPRMVEYSQPIVMGGSSDRWYEGAYGPAVRKGLPEVVALLKHDRETRRCFLPIYAMTHLVTSPHALDVPCTLGYGFAVEDGDLVISPLMRSSDAWVGFVYDSFVVATVAHAVKAAVGKDLGGPLVRFHAMSHHIYEEHVEAAREVDRLSIVYLKPLTRPSINVTLKKVEAAEIVACHVLVGEPFPEEAQLAMDALQMRAAEHDLYPTDPEYALLVLACSRRVKELKSWVGVPW